MRDVRAWDHALKLNTRWVGDNRPEVLTSCAPLQVQASIYTDTRAVSSCHRCHTRRAQGVTLTLRCMHQTCHV
jgi:hypothetical protein